MLEREIKQRRDALEMLKKAERPELIQKEEAELAILASYMPQQLTREQIRAEVEALAAQHGREFRTLMPIAARALKGRADGRLVNEVVREVTAASYDHMLPVLVRRDLQGLPAARPGPWGAGVSPRTGEEFFAPTL